MNYYGWWLRNLASKLGNLYAKLSRFLDVKGKIDQPPFLRCRTRTRFGIPVCDAASNGVLSKERHLLLPESLFTRARRAYRDEQPFPKLAAAVQSPPPVTDNPDIAVVIPFLAAAPGGRPCDIP